MARGEKMRSAAQGCAAPAATYFIQAGLDGPIKIGVARYAQDRIRTLQNAHYLPLRLLGELPFAVYPERVFLDRFCGNRIRGEWFEPSPELRFVAEVAGWRSALVKLGQQPWVEIVDALEPYRWGDGIFSPDEAERLRLAGNDIEDGLICTPGAW